MEYSSGRWSDSYIERKPDPVQKSGDKVKGKSKSSEEGCEEIGKKALQTKMKGKSID